MHNILPKSRVRGLLRPWHAVVIDEQLVGRFRSLVEKHVGAPLTWSTDEIRSYIRTLLKLIHILVQENECDLDLS